MLPDFNHDNSSGSLSTIRKNVAAGGDQQEMINIQEKMRIDEFLLQIIQLQALNFESEFSSKQMANSCPPLG